MPALPSWDLVITLFILVSIAYGFMMQRERVVVTLVSIYVGVVVTQLLAEPIAQFFAGEQTIAGSFFIRSSASPFTIQAGVFLATIVLMSLKSGLSGAREGGGPLTSVEVLAYAFLNAALVISVVVGFMTPEAQAEFLSHSQNATWIVGHRTLWFLAPIGLMLFSGHRRRVSSDY